jgi:hypothetical protein
MPLLFWCQLLKGWSGRWHYILPDFSLMPHKARWPIPRAAASPSQRKGWKFSHQSFPIATDSYSTCLLGGSDLWKIEKKPTLGRSQKLPGSGSGKDSNRKTKQWPRWSANAFQIYIHGYPGAILWQIVPRLPAWTRGFLQSPAWTVMSKPVGLQDD